MRAYDVLLEMIEVPSDECLIWPHCTDDRGYGRVSMGGKLHMAHRLALQLTRPSPVGKVCSIHGGWVPGHKLLAAHGPCHTPVCFNPRHLSWKTGAENAADRKRDGTDVAVNIGENNGQCTIPDDDVARIRSLYKGPQRQKQPKTGPTQRELAAQFGCSRAQIARIVTGQNRTDQLEN